MKYRYSQFKELLPELHWSVTELASKLSLIGFETEVDGEILNITLTHNRKDCQQLPYLVFDLAAIYNLPTAPNLVTVEPGEAVQVTPEDVDKLLGTKLTKEQWHRLERLGFIVSYDQVRPPLFRDISTKADVAEEILRLVGFDSLVVASLDNQSAPPSSRYWQQLQLKNNLRLAFDQQLGLGLTETLSSSFSHKGEIKLKNPFNQAEPYLRFSLMEGLLRTLAKNPYLKQAGFFEIGDIYLPEEKTYLGIVISGYKNYEMLIQQIGTAIGQTLNFKPVAEEIAKQYEVKQPRIYFAEIDIDLLPQQKEAARLKIGSTTEYQAISKFPPLVRSVTLPSTTAENLIQEFIKLYSTTPSPLLLAELNDTYHNVETNQATATYRLIFQTFEHSFTEDQIKTIDESIARHFFQN